MVAIVVGKTLEASAVADRVVVGEEKEAVAAKTEASCYDGIARAELAGASDSEKVELAYPFAK